jgi:glycosyltransferase involved in cell wall biosynthesis
MAERWVQDGHSVRIFSGHPGYNVITQGKRQSFDVHNGVEIIRVALLPENKKNLWLRFGNHILFVIRAIWHVLLFEKYDLMLINSYPPIIMGLTARIICKFTKKPYIYHCNDLHPESARIAGYLKNKHAYKILRKIDTTNCRKASLVITMSQDMANTLIDRGLEGEYIRILNVILDTYDDPADIPSQFLKTSEDEFHVLFAGNMGNFQGLDNIIKAAKILKDNKKIKFFFMGDGFAKNALIKKSHEMLNETIFFIPFQPPEVAFNAMKNADLGVVSLSPGIYKVAFPSKTIMYLAAGCPLLALIEEESELAREILEKKIGYVCSQQDSKLIAKTVKIAWKDRDFCVNRRESIRTMAQKSFNKDVFLNEWSKIIASYENMS